MDNLFVLQEKVKEYLQLKFKEHYGLEIWKDTLVFCRNKNTEQLKKIWDVFGEEFVFKDAIADVKASNNEWDACLVLEYSWICKGSKIDFRVTLVNDEVRFVQVVDMYALTQKFGEKTDLANEFEKNVIMFNALKN